VVATAWDTPVRAVLDTRVVIATLQDVPSVDARPVCRTVRSEEMNGGAVEDPVATVAVEGGSAEIELNESLQHVVEWQHVPYRDSLARRRGHLVRGVLALVPVGQVGQSCH